jgi:hypothetical protein
VRVFANIMRRVSSVSGSATWAAPAFLVAVTVVCYWKPMTSDDTSVLWDAADYYRIVQNYLAGELHQGRLPFWSPFPWSGYPFLADPQVGAWYPPNWPFFATGVSSHALFAEHCLHAVWASLGAYLLSRRLSGKEHRSPAVLAGLSYGLSGFFAGHSSHTTMLQTAAWTPWLLLLFDRALASDTVVNTALAGLAAGIMILAGHFQTALYSFLALALFALSRSISSRKIVRGLSIAAVVPIVGTAVSAIGTAPGLELAINSVRANLHALQRTEGFVGWEPLITLVQPDHYGVWRGAYSGPVDITQYYWYAGILVVPLAAVGVIAARWRWTALLLIGVPIWYAVGHSGGLYLWAARLPGFSSVRAPVNIWFVPALGLALLAGAGLQAIVTRSRIRGVGAAVAVFAAVDLFLVNFAMNPLAYARSGYEELYGWKEEAFKREVTDGLPPLSRFDAPPLIAAFGPLSHFLDVPTEVTYGYGPMPLTGYDQYVGVMRQSNAKLRNALNVSRWADANGVVQTNAEVLPRAFFPAAITRAIDTDQSLQALLTLDPSQRAIVLDALPVERQDGSATAVVTDYSPGHYRIRTRNATASLMIVSNPWFPGWHATSGDRPLQLVRADHALTGIVVPPGEHDIELDYRSSYFALGVFVTIASALACIGSLFVVRRRTPGRTGIGSGDQIRAPAP